MAVLSLLLIACQKEYSVETSTTPNANGTWEFAEGQSQFSGNVDTAYIDSSNAVKILFIIGTASNGSESFKLQLYGTNFGTGEYRASLFESSLDYTSSSSFIYQANQLAGEFIVNVTSYGNNMIAGTFSGEGVDGQGNLIQISSGKFSASLLIGNTSTPTVSSGVLGDSSGFCKPVTVNGAFSPGVALTSANTVAVDVTVAAPGSYAISSNTANGISFSSVGSFSAAGGQTINLVGNGTPVNAGTQDYVITYGNSQCSFSIDFGPGSGAVYTLGGSNGDCTPLNISGNYVEGTSLDATNTVQVQVNVATIGSYSIVTDNQNGVSFGATGAFTGIGTQNIILTGSGTPLNDTTVTFSVITPTDTCSFQITFLPSAAPSGDYFPTTLNSNWVYSLVGGTAADSIKTVVIDYSPTFAGSVYSTFTTDLIPPSGLPDSGYYRKPGGDYYQYFNYSNYIPFDQPVDGELIFLKDNVAVGTTWQSPNISGSISGVPFAAYIKMTLLEKGVPVTIGTFNFPDVIKVKYEYFVVGSSVVVETDNRWFARNVGEIFFDFDDGTNSAAYEIGRYQVF